MEVAILEAVFKINHGPNAAEVRNMDEARAREVGGAIREGEIGVKSIAESTQRHKHRLTDAQED